jgi:hypothetical protein
MDGRKHAADPAWDPLIRHGAVSDGEMRFLDETVSIDLQADVVIPGRRPAVKRRVNQRL